MLSLSLSVSVEYSPTELSDTNENRSMSQQSPFALANVRAFIAFRILFNARFYYPVFAILFLDFGLSMEQFALLNVAWAATIVILEVPSGALADLVGRRRLVVAAAMIMVVEIALLCFVPLGDSTLVFAVFLINRILSGAAEASASGADEALAYDSLKIAGMESAWPRVLEILMRLQSAAFFLAMALGALVYDPEALHRICGWVGVSASFDQQDTMRFPLYLNLLSAVFAATIVLRLKDVSLEPDKDVGKATVSQAFSQTLAAGKWIWRTRFALIVILCALGFDSVSRLFITLISKYYRLIGLPEASFGVIGSAMVILGFFTPTCARWMSGKVTPVGNFWILAAILMSGLVGIALCSGYWGLAFAAMIFVAMSFIGYFSSLYLNEISPSDMRATVLSFRGLAINLAFGAIGLLYAAEVRALDHLAILDGRDGVDTFGQALIGFPWFFAVVVAALMIAGRILLRDTDLRDRKTG